jgi:glucose-6-phosphate isomerase
VIFYETPFKLELIGRILHKNGEPLAHNERKVSDLEEVLMEPKRAGPEGIAYYMYRDVHTHGTLRYDVTLIPPRMFGDEFVKTYGHYHPEAKPGLSYPELYQVLNGEALFIMQKRRRDDSMDCIISRCRNGDVIFVPPNYGHVMVNPNPSSTLVSANIVSNSFSSEYGEYKENRGGAYYYTKDGLKQNLNCIVRDTLEMEPEELLAMNRILCTDLLEEITKRPDKLSFLEDPSSLPTQE